MNTLYKRLPLVFLLALCLNVLPGQGHAEGPSLPIRPDAYVTDLAGVISPADEQKLNAYLSELERKTTAQMLVLILPALEGRSIEELSIELAHDRWGLGQEGKDNGLLLTVAIADRKYRIEVGYGLEGILPDSLVGSMGRDYLVPFFRQGDYAGGILRAVSAMASRVAAQAGVTLEASPPAVEPPSPARKPSILGSFLSIIVLLLVMLFVIRNPGLALAFLLGSSMGGHRRSGFGHGPFGGGGGGFGGGLGGGFGGGGASGGW